MGAKLSSQRNAYELPHFDDEAPGNTLSNRKRRAVSSQAAILHHSSQLQHAREQHRGVNKKDAVLADFSDGSQTTTGVSYCYKGVDGLVIGAQQTNFHTPQARRINDDGEKVRRSSAGDGLVSSTSRVKYGAAAAAAAAVGAARQQQKTVVKEDVRSTVSNAMHGHTLLIMPSPNRNEVVFAPPDAAVPSASSQQQKKLEMVLNTTSIHHHNKLNEVPSSSASSAMSSTDHSVSASSPSSLVVSEAEENELNITINGNSRGDRAHKLGEVNDAANGSQAQAAALIENGEKDVLEVAATKIQAAFRGHLARKTLKEQGRLPSTRTLPADMIEGNDLLGNGLESPSPNHLQHQQSGSSQLNVPSDFQYRQNHLGVDGGGGGSGSSNGGVQHFSPSSAASTTTSTAAVFNDEALR